MKTLILKALASFAPSLFRLKFSFNFRVLSCVPLTVVYCNSLPFSLVTGAEVSPLSSATHWICCFLDSLMVFIWKIMLIFCLFLDCFWRAGVWDCLPNQLGKVTADFSVRLWKESAFPCYHWIRELVSKEPLYSGKKDLLSIQQLGSFRIAVANLCCF